MALADAPPRTFLAPDLPRHWSVPLTTYAIEDQQHSAEQLLPVGLVVVIPHCGPPPRPNDAAVRMRCLFSISVPRPADSSGDGGARFARADCLTLPSLRGVAAA